MVVLVQVEYKIVWLITVRSCLLLFPLFQYGLYFFLAPNANR